MNLLEELDRVIVSQEKEHRTYIGASSIGDECALKLWRKFQGHREEFDAKSLRRFEDGHAVEARIVSWLEKIPSVILFTKDEDGNQFGFEALDGKYQGHFDGVIKWDGKFHVLEIKATTTFGAFQKAKEKYPAEYVLQKWNEDYYAQAMTYCKYAELDSHLLICADAGGRNLDYVITPANNEYADALLMKAKRIADAKTPPQKSGGRNYWKCKMCAFYGDCFGT